MLTGSILIEIKPYSKSLVKPHHDACDGYIAQTLCVKLVKGDTSGGMVINPLSSSGSTLASWRWPRINKKLGRLFKVVQTT
jgi:hypothetical protein